MNKSKLEPTGNRADHIGDRISELENRNLEIIQVEERTNISKKK